MIDIAVAPILLAAAVSVVIGWAWYSPRVFGGAWMRLSNLAPEEVERGKKRTLLSTFIGLLANMLIAYVMAYFGIALQIYGWVDAVELGVWCWAGFAAPLLLSSVLWDQKPVRLYLIDASYWLVSFIVMALVLLYVSALFDPGQYNAPTESGYLSGQ